MHSNTLSLYYADGRADGWQSDIEVSSEAEILAMANEDFREGWPNAAEAIDDETSDPQERETLRHAYLDGWIAGALAAYRSEHK